MKKHWSLFLALQIFLAAYQTQAGTIFYNAIPATGSDEGSGISSDNQYTSAVDGGNSKGTDRVINGITLFALTANGQTSTADNCTLNALAGALSNAGGSSGSIQADGILKDVLSDMTFNNGAGDGSQQEIVLDPESLESGATYDLRIYICNSAGQNRQVNLSFVGDGQAAVETGFFNEDDARTSAGGFKERNQVYYINYRFSWDGDSTPGVTITQKSGSAPFVLYALTNQVVPAGGDEAQGGGEESLTTGLVNAESDEVGVSSDDFYTSESLNTHGKWVKLDKWGTCWQPTKVASGWGPYTNGSWRECDDCGWTFVSDEPWAWACYHYGRWARVKTGCGWVWVPGKVWAPAWVSWRQGKDQSCDCVGWAPLPPEASCQINVGVSTWVDRTCDIGPDCYTFVNVRDFGSDSYSGCGCIYERGRNITIIIETINITNICYNRGINIYCGGPNRGWCNERIRRFGGKEVGQIFVKRYDNQNKIPGGKHSHLDGNQLALVSPNVRGGKNAKHNPKVTETLGKDKLDHGWGGVKDPNKQKELRNQIAEQSKGKDPKTDKATLPPDVAQKIGKHHGGGGNAQHTGGVNTTGGQGTLGGSGQHPGGKGKGGANAQTNTTGGQAGGGSNQHPGGKGNKGQKGAGGGSANATGGQANAGGGQGGGGGHHPGQKKSQGGGGQGANTAGDGSSGNNQTGGGSQHPGKKGKGGNQAGASGGQGGTAQGGGGQGGGKGKKHQQTQGGSSAQGGGGQGGGGKGNKRLPNQGTSSSTQSGGGQGGGGQGGGSSLGGAKHKHQGGQGGQGGGGAGASNKNQGQMMPQGGGGQGGGGGQVQHRGQQGQHQQGQQQQGQGTGGGKKAKPSPTPTPR